MSEEKATAPDRPRQVTLGTWIAGGCSAAMLLVVGSVITRLHDLDFRTGVSGFLADQRRAGITMSLDEALLVIRIGLLVCGAVAAAILVLAYFASRRDRSARIAMSALSVPMLVTGVFVDPFLAGFVVAATVLLWTSPASAWFAGRSPEPAVPAGPGTTPPPRPDLPAYDPTPAAPVQPVTPPVTPQPSPAWPPPPPPYAAPPPAPTTGNRPVRVLVAGLLAAALSALMAGAMLLTAFVVQSAAGRSDLQTVLRDNPSFAQSRLSVDQVATACSVIAVLVALWSVTGLVLAGFAIAGRSWARTGLLITAGLAGLAALVSSLAFPGFLVITAATVLTGVLLLNPDVNAWYAGRPRPSAQQQAPPPDPW